MPSQILPFTCRVVDAASDLDDACAVRAEAYGRQLPDVELVRVPDAVDRLPGTTVILCRDKASGRPIGTTRIQTTTRSSRLQIESCIDLPDHTAFDGRAEVTTLAVTPRAHPLAKIALWKAGYLYCLANQTRWLLIGARNPALVRQYSGLGAEPLYDDGRTVDLPHAAGLPHQILYLDVTSAERNWFNANHSMFGFMFRTVHPDIELFARPAGASPRRESKAA